MFLDSDRFLIKILSSNLPYFISFYYYYYAQNNLNVGWLGNGNIDRGTFKLLRYRLQHGGN